MSEVTENSGQEALPKCGIVMPISSIDGCPAEHWLEVFDILKEVIKEAGFEPNLVSDSDESGIIQKRIIRNLYSNEIVVCDVSAKNPNVMFELGMRLAFDKPTIIIKDDQTDYSFDTSVIEHVPYPRDLRFTKILNFKEVLKRKIESTYKASKEDENYTTFLKHFGEFTVANLGQKEVSSEKYVVESLNELKEGMEKLRLTQQSQMPLFYSNRLSNSKVLRKAFIKKAIEEFVNNNKLEDKKDIIDQKLQNQLLNYMKINPSIGNSDIDDKELRIIISDLLFE